MTLLEFVISYGLVAFVWQELDADPDLIVRIVEKPSGAARILDNALCGRVRNRESGSSTPHEVDLALLKLLLDRGVPPNVVDMVEQEFDRKEGANDNSEVDFGNSNEVEVDDNETDLAVSRNGNDHSLPSGFSVWERFMDYMAAFPAASSATKKSWATAVTILMEHGAVPMYKCKGIDESINQTVNIVRSLPLGTSHRQNLLTSLKALRQSGSTGKASSSNAGLHENDQHSDRGIKAEVMGGSCPSKRVESLDQTTWSIGGFLHWFR